MSHLQKAPLLLDPRQRNEVFSLRRVEFQKSGGYDERWLQELVSSRPEVLPICDIEPAFAPAISVCVELPLASNFLDVLLVTPSGNLIAVECKLWRNHEARRKVIAQTIDYAAKLQALGYAELQSAIRQARRNGGFDLYRHVVKEAGEPEPSMEESEFIDAVSRNLRRGRCLLLIVGDGIREEAESMTEFLQQHAGAHFALAMVALEIYEAQEIGHWLVVPSVPVQTTNIVRGIVRIEEGSPVVTAPPPEAAGNRGTTLSEDEFFARIDKLRDGAGATLRTFLEAQQDLLVDYAVRKIMVVHMNADDSCFTPFAIYPTGVVETGWTKGQKTIAKLFSESLAAAIPGALVRETANTWYVPQKSNGKRLTVLDILDNQAGWRAALEVLFNAMTRAAQPE